VFFFEGATIQNAINLQFEKDENGNFVLPPNKEHVYNILSGDGLFLNKRGKIVQDTYNNELRKISIYFDKVPKYLTFLNIINKGAIIL